MKVADRCVVAALGMLAIAGCTGDTDGAFPGGDFGSAGGPPAQATSGVGGANVDGLEVILEPIRARLRIPALGAVVVRDGGVIAEGVVGVRRVGEDAPVTLGDSWYLGAATHSMTAALAAVLVESGAIAWSSTVSEVLPEIAVDPSFANVTLEALLGERGGVPAALPQALDLRLREKEDPIAIRLEAVRILLATSSGFAEGERHASPASQLVAAAMLERRGGESWEDLLRVRLLEPLGMSACSTNGTGVDAPWNHGGSPLVASAPGAIDEWSGAGAPMGSLRCPLAAWARFAAFELLGSRGEATPLLGSPSFAKLQTPINGPFALGLACVSRPWAGDRLALNRGSDAAKSFALLWIAPEKNTAFLFTANAGGDDAERAADAAIGELVSRFVAAP